MKDINSQVSYRAYGYRWVVLGLYGLATVTIQLMWTTFFSIATDAWKFYGFQDAVTGVNAIDLLSIIFMVGMIVLSFPVMAAFEKFGFQKAVGFGVILTGISAIYRGIFGSSYTALIIASVGFAIAQPFILNAPGLVAGKWFPANERATANSVGLLCNYIGMCVGLLLTPVLLDHGMDIPTILLYYGIFGVICAILFVLFVREEPPTPPCPPEEAHRASFLEGVRGCFRKKNFVIVLSVFFIMYGIFNTFFTMIEPILVDLSDSGVDSTQVGMLGVIILAAGILGSLVVSMVSDKDPKQRRLRYAILSNLIGGFGLLLFLFSKSFSPMMVASLLYGFFIIGSAPLMLTYAAESSYPTSEGTSEGLMMWSGNIAGVLFLGIAGLFSGNLRLLMILIVCITFLYLIPLKMGKENRR